MELDEILGKGTRLRGKHLLKVTGTLEAERTRVQNFLIDKIGDIIELEASRRQTDEEEPACDCGPECSFAECLTHFVLEVLRGKGLWPPTAMRDMSLHSIWNALNDVEWTKRKLDRSRIRKCESERCVGRSIDYEDDNVTHLGQHCEVASKESQAMLREICYECARQSQFVLGQCEHHTNEVAR